MKSLAACRTAQLGGHVSKCDHCEHQQHAYNSCRNRHCPKCQAAARVAWLEERRTELLPVEYFHVVFTLPDAMARLAWQNKRVLYDLLFRAAADTLLEIAADPKHLGAELGFLGVLHTWGQNLQHHPHVHFVVPGGGLAPAHDAWRSCPTGFFLPVRVLSRVFRGKFLAMLRAAYRNGQLTFHNDLAIWSTRSVFDEIIAAAYKHEWVVYAKPPFGGPEQVLKYLARYTHRVAISNDRLLKLEHGQVTFRWKNYAAHGKQQTMTLSAVEFLRRFLLHALPSGFVRIRHYGFLANRHRTERVSLCRQLLGVKVEAADSVSPEANSPDIDSQETETSLPRCPHCGIGSLLPLEIHARPTAADILARPLLDSS